MLVRFFKDALRRHAEKRAVDAAIDQLETDIASHPAAGIRHSVEMLDAANRPLTEDQKDRLLHAALKRGDADIFMSVLPGNNPNHLISMAMENGFHVEPLLSAAILLDKPMIAMALAQRPDTDLAARGSTYHFPLLGDAVTVPSPPPLVLARDAKMGEVVREIATVLTAQHNLYNCIHGFPTR